MFYLYVCTYDEVAELVDAACCRERYRIDVV